MPDVPALGAEEVGGLAHPVCVDAGLNTDARPGAMEAAVLPEAGFVLEDYDPADAAEVSRRVRAGAGRGAAVGELLRLYEEVIAEYAAAPPDRELEGMAAAAHLRTLVDLMAIRPLTVVVDAGNGMAGYTVPAVLGDTSLLGPRQRRPAVPASAPARRNLLYRIGAFFVEGSGRSVARRFAIASAARASAARQTHTIANKNLATEFIPTPPFCWSSGRGEARSGARGGTSPLLHFDSFARQSSGTSASLGLRKMR